MKNFISRLWRNNRARVILFSIIAGSMIVIQIINSMSNYALDTWGIIPRRIDGLPGIVLTPWLHGSWTHLFANLSGLLILGWLATLHSVSRFCVVSIFIILVGGGLVWVFGRSAVHVGASGWIFGLWGWLLANAWFQRRMHDIIIAVVVILLYGGLWYGLIPRAGISFEGHAAGLIAGIICSSMGFRAQK